MKQLSDITDLLYGDGEPVTGGELTLEEAIALGEAHGRGKPYRVVRNWIWTVLEVSEKHAEYAERTGLQPIVVYAHEVMYDSSYRFSPGDWVRTTPLLNFTEPCLFETTNTLYILVGEGKRKIASAKTIVSIM